MEYWKFLLYKCKSVLRRVRVYKKTARGLCRIRAAGISHRRGSWLACRREMLLKRQKFWPRSVAGEASEILAQCQRFAIHFNAYLLDGIRAGFAGAHAQRLFQLAYPH